MSFFFCYVLYFYFYCYSSKIYIYFFLLSKYSRARLKNKISWWNERSMSGDQVVRNLFFFFLTHDTYYKSFFSKILTTSHFERFTFFDKSLWTFHLVFISLFSQVLVEEKSFARILTLNRPRQLNALSFQMVYLFFNYPYVYYHALALKCVICSSKHFFKSYGFKWRIF